MACMECGEDRALCHCTIEASPDGSVVITGNGEPGNPFVISAPGAGAGTRFYDRATVYDPELDGTYQLPLPAEYEHFDFYGPGDPRGIPGYTPAQFDGWYATANNAPIVLRYAAVVESATGVTAVVGLPLDIPDGALAVASFASGSTAHPVPPSGAGWAEVGYATDGTTATAVFIKKLTAADSGDNHLFTDLVSPSTAALEVYTGTDDLDAAAATAFEASALHLDIPGVTAVTPLTLLLAFGSLGTAGPVLSGPAEMAKVNGSTGTGLRHTVSSQLLTTAGSSGARSFSTTVLSAMTGVLLALHPRLTFTYYLWINGLWTAISNTSGNGSATGEATTIGDGVHYTFTVPHSLGTLDCLVEVVNLETGQTCYPVVQRRGVDQVYLDFGDTIPAAQSRRVLISPL